MKQKITHMLYISDVVLTCISYCSVIYLLFSTLYVLSTHHKLHVQQFIDCKILEKNIGNNCLIYKSKNSVFNHILKLIHFVLLIMQVVFSCLIKGSTFCSLIFNFFCL